MFFRMNNCQNKKNWAFLTRKELIRNKKKNLFKKLKKSKLNDIFSPT